MKYDFPVYSTCHNCGKTKKTNVTGGMGTSSGQFFCSRKCYDEYEKRLIYGRR